MSRARIVVLRHHRSHTKTPEGNLVSRNDDQALLVLAQSFRGLYARVARRVGVDPSYVSRVANGRRRAPDVEKALAEELRKVQRVLR